MPAAAIALADRRDVMGARARRPGVRTYRNLGSLRRARERNCVGSVGKQIIRNEFVEALVAFVDQIKLHDCVPVDSFAANRLQSFQMQLQNRLETALHFWTGG